MARKSSTKSKPRKKKQTKRSTAQKRAPQRKKSSSAARANRPKKEGESPRGPLSNRTPSKEVLTHAFHEMVRARLIDQKIITLYKQNKCHFQIGAAGHEGVQVAAAQVFRAGKDWFYPYYRDMGLMAALGMTNAEFLLNALNKTDDPNSHGRQMPMHWGSVDLRVVSQSSPTGTQFLQAVGCAYAVQHLSLDEVVYVSAGEGTCAQGDYHEALNWAARKKLPIVFLIQNNNFAISVPVEDQIAGSSVYQISDGYEHLERFEIDGSNFEQSYQACVSAHERALKGDGPSLIEAHVPRLQSHSISDNHLKYRSAEDIEREKKRCPIETIRSLLIKKKIATQKKLESIEKEIRQQIDDAADWALEQPDPDPASVESHTLSETIPVQSIGAEPEAAAEGDAISMVDALNHALDEELSNNPEMLVFGQDVAGGKGGVFTVTAGLTKKHGEERVFNGPLAESSLVGVAIGMATVGLKPVVEIQFGDYIWTAMMQIRNELAMLRYRSAGDFSCPLVVRVAVGGYIRGAHYHSQNIEATFSHFPGMHVILPSNAADAKGLLKAAIRCDDPVLFLEHKGLYRQVHAQAPEPDSDTVLPIGKAKVVRAGTDLTIVAYGALVQKSLITAEQLAAEGVAAEVIDLRSISPFDTRTVFESVRKTGRVLIAHEDVEFMGFGAEIAAQIADQCFEHLDAPVKRVGMKNIAAVPHAPVLEQVVLPQNEDVLVAARNVLKY